MELMPVEYDGMTIYVTPDYYMESGVRVSVGLTRAFQIADEKDMMLPTPAMVDAIWNQADIKLDPKPLPPSNEMTLYNYLIRHETVVNEQLKAYGDIRGKLVAGHKKDIVNIDRNSPKVAIYGWHRSNGRPIQPYSTVHGREYHDYSHGLRLVSKTAKKDGQRVRLQ